MSMYQWTNLGFDRDCGLHQGFSGISAHHNKHGYSYEKSDFAHNA